VIENNLYHQYAHYSYSCPMKDIASAAKTYGIPGVVVDGQDVLQVYNAAKEAVERARAGEGPTLIEAKTYRYFPHTSDDDDRSYRTREEVEEAKHNDPIARFAETLKEQGVIDAAAIDALWAETKADVDAQIDQAWNAADPEPSTLERHVYFEGEGA